MIEYMGAPPARSATPVTVLVVDGTASLVAELKDDSKADFADAVGVASYSARNSTVLANVRFFERTWEAIELVKAEERSRKTAELMQDILVHDIRNFNQITRANVELLRDRLTDEKLMGFAEWALDSIDGATELIQKTRTLANVISGENVSLTHVDLSESVERSFSLVGKVFRDKRLELSSRLPPEARVLADSLLDQVFVNILSNAVKYTDGSVVPLEIQLEERDEMLAEGSGKQRYWLVTITDHGRGIPDEMKESAAMRYLGTAKGRGLGLSIAHALVLNRYAGKMQIRNRVESDHSKGTRVEVWLPKA
jgi:signal transduction histidine kinase